MSLETVKSQKNKMSQLGSKDSSLFTFLKIKTFLSTGRNERLIFNQPRTDFCSNSRRPQGICWPGRELPRGLQATMQVPRQFCTMPSSSGEERGWR